MNTLTRNLILIAAGLAMSAPTSALAQAPSGVWVSATAGRAAPSKLLAGGTENGKPLYICRGNHAGGVHPGKLVKGNCNIGYGGKELHLKNFTLLTKNANYRWVNASTRLPANTVYGGKEAKRPLAVCRAKFKGGTHPGKVVRSQCNIGYGGKEYTLKPFQVLTFVKPTIAPKTPPKVGRSIPQLRPVKPRPAPIPLIKAPVAKLDWVSTTAGKRVDNVLAGGREANGTALPVCMARHANGLHPGKVVKGNCNIGYGGKELYKKSYRVLVGTKAQVQWKPATFRGKYISGGYEGKDSRLVCRAKYKGGVHPGKLVNRKCNIGWGGKEIVLGDYELLFLK